MINTILFDMDGVLIDSFDAWVALLNATATHFGHPLIDSDRFRQVYGQPTKDDVALFFPGTTVQDVDSYYTTNFSRYAKLVKASPGAVQITNRLKTDGYHLAVITNTPGPVARPILDSLGFRFDIVVGGDEVASAKPAPDMIFEACNLLDRSPSTTMVIGDSVYDEEAASRAGTFFTRVHSANNANSIKDIRSLPALLKQLAGQAGP